MPHAIIRDKAGRRHEVEFDESAIRVEIHASEETIEIFVEADINLPEEQRCFTLVNIPRDLFSKATADATKRGNVRLR